MLQPNLPPREPAPEIRYVDLANEHIPPWEQVKQQGITQDEIDQTLDRLDPPELNEQERAAIAELRRAHFFMWDPLATSHEINVMVIDGAGIDHNRSTDAGIRTRYPIGYFDHAGMDGALVEYQEEEIVDIDMRRLELGSMEDFISDIREINEEIERTGNRPDAINMSIGIGARIPGKSQDFFAEWKQKVESGEVPLVEGTLYYEMVRLANNTDGPVFIAAGNSGRGTVNLLTLAFPWADNIVVVGANDDSGRAPYSSDTPHFFVNGDLDRAPVCDANGMEGIVTSPGGHALDFEKELPSYTHLEGRSLQQVGASDADYSTLLRSLDGIPAKQVPASVAHKAFNAEQVRELHEELGYGNSMRRLERAASMMEARGMVVDGATLFSLASPESDWFFSPNGISGFYYLVEDTLRFAPDCDPSQIDEMQGTSFSSPKALNSFIRDYLAERRGKPRY